jgi:hypothetical protein
MSDQYALYSRLDTTHFVDLSPLFRSLVREALVDQWHDFVKQLVAMRPICDFLHPMRYQIPERAIISPSSFLTMKKMLPIWPLCQNVSISCAVVDTHGSLLVASRTCIRSSVIALLPNQCEISDLSLHLSVVHNRCSTRKPMFHQREPLERASIIPFCTFRTPALMSYKVRLLTWSFRLFKSILVPVKRRRSYSKVDFVV